MSENIEIWKPIGGFKNYSVSNLGNIKNNNTNHILKVKPDAGGYTRTNIVDSSGKIKRPAIHRLVAYAFLNNSANKRNLNVNHKNGIKYDNRSENLEYVTQSGNVKHAIENGLLKLSKKKVAQYDKNNNFINIYDSVSAAAIGTGFERSGIGKVCNGRYPHLKGYIWKFVNPEIKDTNPIEHMVKIDGYEGYSVTRDGRVYSHKRKKYIKYFVNHGYCCIKLMKGKKRDNLFVHRLVANAYVPNPDPKNKIFVNHKNKIRTDNNVSNLEWVTPSENIIHSNQFKKN